MSYISGHYRKGHFRNGKWVSGGYVKSHYRSGIRYGTWSSIESSLLDTKDKESDSSCAGNLSGEAYLNSRREYWRNELAKNPTPPRKKNNQNKTEPSRNISKQKRVETIKIIQYVLFAIVIIGLFIAFFSIPPEVMNWMIAIIVLLAFLKR